MGRHHDLVEALGPGRGVDLDLVGGAGDLGDGLVQADRPAEGGQDGVDVALRAAVDRAPGGLVAVLEQAVVGEEPGEGDGRHVEERRLGSADQIDEPMRHEVPVEELGRPAARLQQVAERDGGVGRSVEQGPCPAG